jgi:methionyl-tRNA formyltransferase
MLAAFKELVAPWLQGRSVSYAFSPKNPNPDDFLSAGCFMLNIKETWETCALNYDLIFSIHCKQIFPAELVNRVTCINLHPGYNPHNRGWFPQAFCLMDGQPAGATLHVMEPEVDRGPVIDRIQVVLESWDTSLTAYEKLQEAEKELLRRHLPLILEGVYSVTETEDGNYNGIADYRALCRINLEETGTWGEFLNRLRALTHPPYQNAYFMTPEGRKVFVSVQLTPDE